MFGDDVRAAKAICLGCPVASECLGDALDNDTPFGVWGAKSFEERTRICPVCRGPKTPKDLGCSDAHSLKRLARLVELQEQGDPTVSVSRHLPICAPTFPGCLQPRGRSHSTAKAYRQGCRCEAAREALYAERAARPPARPREDRSARERFMSFVQTDEADHWLWNGSTNGSGYGNFWDGKRTVRAHIFAYRTFVGVVPESTRLRTSAACARRWCVNPYHREIAA